MPRRSNSAFSAGRLVCYFSAHSDGMEHEPRHAEPVRLVPGHSLPRGLGESALERWIAGTLMDGTPVAVTSPGSLRRLRVLLREGSTRLSNAA